MDKKKNLFEWLNQILSEPYYIFHFLAFFSYIVFRSSSNAAVSPRITAHLLNREIQAGLAFAALVVVKMAREETWESFVADILFYAKIFLTAVSLILDYRLALWYLVVFSVIYITTQQPAFDGLGTASKLTPLQLETILTEGNTSRFWLVEFRASCSCRCIRSSRCFPELAITYSTKILSFGIVDLGLFPNAAEKFGSMGQLPVYILFENAAEVTRFPELDFEAKASHPDITKRLLSRHFELDRLLLQYVNGR
ncbi:thioredoxin-related transmembrane protein 2 isoform X2 [Tripterygium wilfordii]|uniref:thioredoxin-related transmembrane protein 2 isoform X2 n=1 Tax=Tripterygium wilfordii TaxID=458696 RepID=UPI0018F82F91|nr:thioredoxin-related transmembrane protein 2 isoform X2 [Tripterygium wilfordii]